MRYALARPIKNCVWGLPLLLALTTGVAHAGSKSQVTSAISRRATRPTPIP